ncbi:hypothetical protein Ssi03_50420 [Sphaerisporangium siamense]|uniref:Uncharacterized protein n=1 Tax=Sphaerisporangium siamense TaxID=795645 RepID=A0A7W7D8H9_9ACTN|nr:hypothetical protein [Sphaerisporangium siamense]MBB4702254.1 hypothetical protein [Sphaerisporangium siamense]GII87052.1 hypothetical protein Ssi03_50420 [Sphaerisporangium siamense]
MATYAIDTNGDIALSAATAKTILNVIAASGGLVKITELSVSFDGTSSTAEPVTVELCASTQAGAGTSTSHTPLQVSGATRTVSATGARNYSAEPTVLTVRKRWLVHPQGGLLVVQFPLSREPQLAATGGWALRCTAPATVNVQAYLEFAENE